MDVWHRTTRRDYIDTIEAMDAGIGRILAALDSTNTARDTIVVFTCDHGGMGPVRHSPLSQGFRTLGEGGIRVPLLVRWPRVLPPGKVFSQPVILMDIAATVVVAAGVAPDRPLDGIDLVPMLQSNAPMHERVFCWQIGTRTAVRKGKWKYRDDEGEKLFDLEADVSEKNDLSKQHHDIAGHLRAEFTKWKAAVRP
jgi:arylsulfatase A-like enzyme